jgi:hypothetical protein
MLSVLTEFEVRKQEIERYFQFLKISPSITEIDVELEKTLKANGFLLLYNLLEATVRKAIEEVHDSFNLDKLKYKELIEEIQTLWITYKYNNFDSKKANFIQETIEKIVDDEVNIDYADFVKKRKANDLSGNVNADIVLELSDKYKFDKNKRVEGKNLDLIKRRRNLLAHGNISFTDCGKNYSIQDMLKYKQEVFLYLQEFLTNIEKFINAKKYKR